MLQFLLSTLIIVDAGPACRAIALEGGGSHGAYEAGVVWALVNLTAPGETSWNIISGISAGALNTAAMIQFPFGQELPMSNFLLNMWKSVNGSSDFYVEWPGGLVAGLLFHQGIYDYSPINKYLRTHLPYGVQRNFSVGATNLDTGLFSTFNESIGAAYIDAIISSSSPPLFFAPHEMMGYSFADGGCIVNLDVFSAIERCLEQTEEENIFVDMIFDNPYANLGNDTKFTTLEVFSRIYSISQYDSSVWFTYNAKVAFPRANYRYVIKPSEAMPGGVVPLNFTPSNLDYEIQMGINDTIKFINKQLKGSYIIDELYQASQARLVFP